MYVQQQLWSFALLLLCVCGQLKLSVARTATKNAFQHNANNLEPQHRSGAAHTLPAPDISNGSGSGSGSGTTATIWKDLALMFRVYQQCSNENLSVCLKVKLLTGLEKAARAARTLKLVEGVQFVKSEWGAEGVGSTSRSGQKPELSEKEIEATLPRAMEAKEHILNNMIIKKLAGFLQDHTLQVKFPDIRQALDNSVTEGRKKDKKGGGGAFIMIPLLLGGTFIPIAYGALAILAGKALIVSKLALVLASIIGIKKLLSGGGGKESQHEVVVQSGSHSGWGRDIDIPYSGWKPGADTAKKL